MGERGVLESKVLAMLKDSATWSIGAELLALTAADGSVLTYRIRSQATTT